MPGLPFFGYLLFNAFAELERLANFIRISEEQWENVKILGHRKSGNQRIREVLIGDFFFHGHPCKPTEYMMLLCLKSVEFSLLIRDSPI